MDNDGVDSDAEPVSELAALLLDRQRNGLAFEEIARRARRQGHKLDRQYLSQVVNGAVKRPGAAKLVAIAKGADLPESTVKEAAARSAGIHVEHNIDIQTSRLLSRLAEMSPTARDRWYRLAEAITDVIADEDQPHEVHTQRRVDEALRRSGDRQERRARDRRQN